MRTKVSRYVTGVVVVAALGLLFDAFASDPPLFGRDPAAFWLLAGCGLVTEMLPLRWLAYDNNGEVTGSWTFLMAMLLTASPAVAVGVTAGLCALADLRSRKRAIKVAFNVADMVLSLSLGAAILDLSGQSDVLQNGGQPGFLWYLAVGVAFVVVFATNTLLTCGVISLSAGVPFRSVAWDHGTDALPTDAMLLALAPIFVITAQRSLWLVPPLLVTTAIVYRTARISLARRHDATHDLLTGLANRRLFDQHLDRAIDHALRRDERVAVVLIDLDGFKAVNDNLGHPVGDRVLIEVANRLSAACRPHDLVARLGGDEFALVLSKVASAQAAADVTWGILTRFEEPIEVEGLPVSLRASAGVALAPDHGDHGPTLLRRADEAMYSAKSARSTVGVHRPGQGRTAIGRLGLLSDLARALEAGELFLEYQPQVALDGQHTVGVEALIRWRHPAIGVIPPGVFMPIAEQTELIGAITERVLTEAARQLAAWTASGRDLRMAVNVSVRNLEDSAFPRTVAHILAAAGLQPGDLVIELTENTTALDRGTVRRALQELSELGVGISVDDFGTGYSSIIQLRDLPVDQIKLDRRFVATMADNARDALIVRAILHLANALGLSTVAEGVEDSLVASLLKDLGCQQAQGFLFARPMSPEELEAWLQRRDRWELPPGHPVEVGPPDVRAERPGRREAR